MLWYSVRDSMEMPEMKVKITAKILTRRLYLAE